MEKYEWVCPMCSKLNYQYINEQLPKNCKGCNGKYIVDSKGKIVSMFWKYL